MDLSRMDVNICIQPGPFQQPAKGSFLGYPIGHRCFPGEDHSSYLSQPPQPAVVYFFLAGVLFSIENAKCWPNLANFDQFWLFCRELPEFFGVLFIDLNNAAVY